MDRKYIQETLKFNKQIPFTRRVSVRKSQQKRLTNVQSYWHFSNVGNEAYEAHVTSY